MGDRCVGYKPDGFRCNNPSIYSVYTEPSDAEGACGKHVNQVLGFKLRADGIGFVKVTLILSESPSQAAQGRA